MFWKNSKYFSNSSNCCLYNKFSSKYWNRFLYNADDFNCCIHYFLLCEFCSPTFSFFRNKTNESGIQNKYGILVQTQPVIQFHCECYHYVTTTVRYNPPRKGGGRRSGGRKSGGRKTGGGRKSVGRKTRTRTRTRKVVTHRETVTFPYYSCRDVSGLFQLKNSREEAMGKTYI